MHTLAVAESPVYLPRESCPRFTTGLFLTAATPYVSHVVYTAGQILIRIYKK